MRVARVTRAIPRCVNLRMDRAGLLLTVLVVAPFACRRAQPPARDTRTACELALGSWRGDDVDTTETDPGALAIAREAIRAQRWRITESTLESREGEGRLTRETLRIVAADTERCDVEATLGDRSRRLNYGVNADGRLRIATAGGAVGMLLRRE